MSSSSRRASHALALQNPTSSAKMPARSKEGILDNPYARSICWTSLAKRSHGIESDARRQRASEQKASEGNR